METNEYKSDKKKKSDSGIYRIIAVQFAACAFMLCLLALVCRLGGAAQLKEKYNNIMSSGMNVSQVIASAKEVAKSVMKPVSENKTIEIPKPSEDESKTEPTEKAPAEENNEEDTYEKSTERTTAQVMSLFSDSGAITSPAHGALTSFFGTRTDPISGMTKHHSAVDIAVSEGTRVSAAWDGIVTNAGYDDTAGNFVWMVHKNGCETLYCHCSKLLVKNGDVIRAGEAIALSGSTGYSTGPHLHFGIKKNGEMVDPLNYLSAENGRI